MKAKSMFGIHAARAACMFRFTAKVFEKVWNRMYSKLRKMPMPRAMPIPFLRYRADSEAPITVSMMMAKDEAPRFQYSNSNSLMFAKPRSF